MKAGALILSFLFIVLTVQPVFIKWQTASPCAGSTVKVKADGSVRRKGGCKKSCGDAKKLHSKRPVKQSEDPCNTCNPFMACNACPYVPGEAQQVFSPSVLIETDNTDGLNDFIFQTIMPNAGIPRNYFPFFNNNI
ncbi:MAG TPA: hypothetical protein VMY77_17250 [Chitinophagaceae bacterium]|nr:hypothetical protein [Chitinophagaceae bacterium]